MVVDVHQTVGSDFKRKLFMELNKDVKKSFQNHWHFETVDHGGFPCKQFDNIDSAAEFLLLK